MTARVIAALTVFALALAWALMAPALAVWGLSLMGVPIALTWPTYLGAGLVLIAVVGVTNRSCKA